MIDVLNKICKHKKCNTRSKLNEDFCEIHIYKDLIEDYIKK